MKLKTFILGLLIFVIGLFMTINPSFSFNLIVIITGAVGVFDGFITIIKALRNIKDKNLLKVVIIKSLFTLVIGASAIAFPLLFKQTIDNVCTVFGFILAVSLVVIAAFGFYTAGKITDDDERKKSMTTESLIRLLLAIIFFIISPKSISEGITTIIGIVGIVAGALIILFQLAIIIKHNKKQEEEIEVVKVSDDDEKTSDTKEDETETEAEIEDKTESEEEKE